MSAPLFPLLVVTLTPPLFHSFIIFLFLWILGRISEKGIQTALKDVRRALLNADVNVKVVDTLIDGVKKRTVGKTVIEGVTADQQFIKAMVRIKCYRLKLLNCCLLYFVVLRFMESFYRQS